jgi:hypothetical protein
METILRGGSDSLTLFYELAQAFEIISVKE